MLRYFGGKISPDVKILIEQVQASKQVLVNLYYEGHNGDQFDTTEQAAI